MEVINGIIYLTFIQRISDSVPNKIWCRLKLSSPSVCYILEIWKIPSPYYGLQSTYISSSLALAIISPLLLYLQQWTLHQGYPNIKKGFIHITEQADVKKFYETTTGVDVKQVLIIQKGSQGWRSQNTKRVQLYFPFTLKQFMKTWFYYLSR